jgi:DNA-binding SARP family transcriptional activator
MLKIRLLGQFNVEAEGQALEIPSRPAQSLLAYLALHAGMAQRREKLAGLFWPEAPESNARGNLRHTLWRVRKLLGVCPQTRRDYLSADDLTLMFDATTVYWLDVAALERKSSDSEPVEQLLEIVSLYRGELP